MLTKQLLFQLSYVGMWGGRKMMDYAGPPPLRGLALRHKRHSIWQKPGDPFGVALGIVDCHAV